MTIHLYVYLCAKSLCGHIDILLCVKTLWLVTCPCPVSLQDHNNIMIQFVFQYGLSALHAASAYDQPSVVELLVESGVQVDIQSKVCWLIEDSTHRTYT